MKIKKTKSKKLAINFHRIAKIAGCILLIPLLGNLAVSGWEWTIADFVMAAMLLFGAGVALEYAAQTIAHPVYRVFACSAIAASLLVIWAELAVGIFY